MMELMKEHTSMPSVALMSEGIIDGEDILELESRKCFEFFWNEANSIHGTKGYGLIRDRFPGGNGISSIASVGYGLGAIIIGVERGWITREQGMERALGTIDTLLYRAENINGFFFHFLDMFTAKRKNWCEVSIIDTAICLYGVIAVGEYFSGEIKDKGVQLYKRIDWQWYLDSRNNQFYMGYSPEAGFCGHWDFTGEQLMLYPLAAASPNKAVDGSAMYSFTRHFGELDGEKFIHSWFGSIFTYQFSHCWIDYRGKVDSRGIDWWENSIIASKNDIQFCRENANDFKGFGEGYWGITACDGPSGYCGRYGAVPNSFDNSENYVDGTIPAAGAAGSIVFTPKEGTEVLKNLYTKHPELWGQYGFKDAINLDMDWVAEDVIGIDKGITLLMIENYRTGLIWKCCMKNEFIRNGMVKTGFKDV